MKEISTKEKILSAARTLFVAEGFAGTSIAHIAKLAGVNHSLIFHHFKNKALLWIAVKQDIVQQSKNETVHFPFEHLSWKACLSELFQRNIAFYQHNPDLIRMINWQRLEKENRENIGITRSSEMRSWIDLIKFYQEKEEIDPVYKPEWVVTFILSLISSAALDPNVFISGEEQYKDYMDFCIKILQIGLQKSLA